MLLATMLGRLGIEAYPALVNTTIGRRVLEYAPSPRLFNHVIVRVDLPGGPYWIDPTQSLVGGSIRSYQPPAYENALVADESASGPETVERGGVMSTTRIHHHFVLGDEQTPTTLEISTAYLGSRANGFRSTWGWTTAADYTRDCVEYYGSYYETARSVREVEATDDRDKNVFRTVEHYELPDFWTEYDDGFWADFAALEIARFLPELTPEDREYPLAVAHPVRYEQTIVVDLPDDWGGIFEPETFELESDAFDFSFESSMEDQRLTLEYTYESASDFVPADAVDDYIDDLAEVDEYMTYSVPQETFVMEEVLSVMGGLVVGLFLAGIAVVLVALRSHFLQRNKDFEEIVDETASDLPWLSIWSRPRATTRALLERRRSELYVLLFTLTAGFINGLDQASLNSVGDGQGFPFIVGYAIGSGVLGGLVRVYLGSWVLSIIGRSLGGTGRTADVRTAVAWSSIVSIVFGLLWLPSIALFGKELFTEEMPRVYGSDALTVAFMAMASLQFAGILWAAVTALKCVAEAHEFSVWKALATYVLAIIALIAVLLAVGLLVAVVMFALGLS